MIDHETIALDRELSIENELRAKLAAATADNNTLRDQLAHWKAQARLWETRCKQKGTP